MVEVKGWAGLDPVGTQRRHRVAVGSDGGMALSEGGWLECEGRSETDWEAASAVARWGGGVAPEWAAPRMRS